MSLAVTTSGRGPRLACVHGWGLSGRVWRPLGERLSDRLTVQAVDLPGHGETPSGPAGLDDWTDALLSAIDTPAVLLGWSLGGLVALNAARREPGAVRGLVLVAMLPRMLRAPDWQWGMKAGAVEATARGLEGDFTTTLHQFLEQQVLSEPGARDAVAPLQDELLERPPEPAGLLRGLDILHEADLRDDLSTITCPVLAIAGERDRIAHPDGMARLAEQLPDAGYWCVPHAAHAPFLSHEREFAERVSAFVARI